MKSPQAVQQEFDIARGMPVTAAQQDKFDILRGRWGLPPLRPQQPAPSGVQPQSSSIPMISSIDDLARLPSGSFFRMPDGQLRQVP